MKKIIIALQLIATLQCMPTQDDPATIYNTAISRARSHTPNPIDYGPRPNIPPAGSVGATGATGVTGTSATGTTGTTGGAGVVATTLTFASTVTITARADGTATMTVLGVGVTNPEIVIGTTASGAPNTITINASVVCNGGLTTTTSVASLNLIINGSLTVKGTTTASNTAPFLDNLTVHGNFRSVALTRRAGSTTVYGDFKITGTSAIFGTSTLTVYGDYLNTASMTISTSVTFTLFGDLCSTSTFSIAASSTLLIHGDLRCYQGSFTVSAGGSVKVLGDAYFDGNNVASVRVTISGTFEARQGTMTIAQYVSSGASIPISINSGGGSVNTKKFVVRNCMRTTTALMLSITGTLTADEIWIHDNSSPGVISTSSLFSIVGSSITASKIFLHNNSGGPGYAVFIDTSTIIADEIEFVDNSNTSGGAFVGVNITDSTIRADYLTLRTNCSTTTQTFSKTGSGAFTCKLNALEGPWIIYNYNDGCAAPVGLPTVHA